MPPPKPAPLPLAPDRAALSNRISLLLANRSSLIQTLNPNRRRNQQANSPASRRGTTASSSASLGINHNDGGDDDDLFKGTRANEGVGYVAEKSAPDTSRENKALRGKLLGKRDVGRGAGARGRVVASDSEEDEGRSGLGKRKRPRKAPTAEDEVVADNVETVPEQNIRPNTEVEQLSRDAPSHEAGGSGDIAVVVNTEDTPKPSEDSRAAGADAAGVTEDSTRKKRRKRKNRNKKKSGPVAL